MHRKRHQWQMLKQQEYHKRGEANNIETLGSEQMSTTAGPQQHQNANISMSAKTEGTPAISGMSTTEGTPKMAEKNTREEKGCHQQQEATEHNTTA